MNQAADIHPDWPEELQRGLSRMHLALAEQPRASLLAYLGLLRKWNRAYNLTAVRDPAQMVARQLLDSLSIMPRVDRGPVLDVGTGAGLPGIPLAIVRPDLPFTLLDTNSKKTRFVQQVVGELGLENVTVCHSRVEQLEQDGGYALITSRAFATLADMVDGSASLLAVDGRWLAMKGVRPDEEIAALPDGLAASVEPLSVPGEDGARHLVVIRRAVE